MKPKVGQRVFSLNIGNAARNCAQVLTPYVVTKVGRKYFSARREDDKTGWTTKQYYLDTWYEKTEYSANSRIYEDPQQWEDEKERDDILNQLRKACSHGHRKLQLSLAQLREIAKIVSL